MLTIRKATVEDHDTIRAIANITFPDTYGKHQSPQQIEYFLEKMYSYDSICKQMKEGCMFYISYKGGVPCGYFSLQQVEEDLFRLNKLYILPLFQRDKVGKTILSEVIKIINEKHPMPCKIELNVDRLNSALEFYKKMGFRIVAEGDFHAGNGYYMNDYIMRKDL